MANARAAKKAARAKEAQTKAAEVKAAEAATEVKAEEPQTVEVKEAEVKTEALAAEPVAEVKETRLLIRLRMSGLLPDTDFQASSHLMYILSLRITQHIM